MAYLEPATPRDVSMLLKTRISPKSSDIGLQINNCKTIEAEQFLEGPGSRLIIGITLL
jgi:hypothetical protein